MKCPSKQYPECFAACPERPVCTDAMQGYAYSLVLIGELREELAEVEHDQWMRWAKNLIPELKQLVQHHLPYGREEEAGICHCKSCDRIKRWEKLFIPYSELTHEQKEQDRKEADIVLQKVLSLQKLSLGGLREEITNILSNNLYMDKEERLSGIGVSTEYILLKLQQALLLAKEGK